MDIPDAPSSSYSPDDASRPRPGKSLVFILGALTVIAPFAIDMYLPALPQIGTELGVDVGKVQLTLSVFLIGMAAGQAFMGPIVDRYGRRAPLLIGLAVFVVACIGCAQAQSMASLLAWRLVMALGSAASLVVPRAVVRDLFNQRESAKMYSMLMLILGISPIFAPMLGGWMIGVTGWRGIFWVLAGIGVACAAVVMAALPDSSPDSRPKTIGLKSALKTYWSLLKDKRFLGATLVAGFMIGTIFTYLSASAFVFIDLHALTPQQYALAFGFNGIGMILASQVNRWLLNRFRVGQVLSGALLGSVLVGAALIVTSNTGWGGLPMVIALLFLNLSVTGFIGPNIGAIAMAPFGEIAGSASALLGTIQFGVGALAGAMVGLLHNGTAMPMAIGIAGCAVASFAIWHTMVRKQVMAAPSSH
ncbi:Bcr/CflA family multidrug efflux MFS transporter [Oleiharenicola lentus]|uniref:Bcr/CflA family multidrug efflux MFS transporter n=1 Tax=Oleiharenicola lentus TaxID=2508720 RepID=UPI003F66917F